MPLFVVEVAHLSRGGRHGCHRFLWTHGRGGGPRGRGGRARVLECIVGIVVGAGGQFVVVAARDLRVENARARVVA